MKSSDPSPPKKDEKVPSGEVPAPTPEPEIIGGASGDPAYIAQRQAADRRRLAANRRMLAKAQSAAAKLERRERQKLATAAAKQAVKDRIAAERQQREAERKATLTAARERARQATTARKVQEEVAKEPARQERAALTQTRTQAQRITDLIALAGGPQQILDDIRRQKAELSLYEFVKQAWPYVESVAFVDSWHIRAICQHLEAVTRGKIRRLIINIPPRCSKSTLVSVLWPAWIWAQDPRDYGPLSGPHVQMLFASYSQTLSERDAIKCRRLIESNWYQKNWGKRFNLVGDQNTKRRYETDKKGFRLATSVGGTLTGEGGNLIVIDDPLNAQEAISETVLESTNRWWDEAMSTRLNDPKTGAYVIIMQRLHEDDTTGHILSKDTSAEYTHLMLPMRHDSVRHCSTYIGGEQFFTDPRVEDGELLCPERFDPRSVNLLEQELGPFAFAGQMQQIPRPRGGGIILSEWWQPWPPKGEEEMWNIEVPGMDGRPMIKPRYPDFDFILVSVDTAYTEKDENDYSACTVWGSFTDRKGNPRVMLMSAWQERLELHALVQRIIRTASRRNLEADAILVENKASGLSVVQELKRLVRQGDFAIHTFDPKKMGGGDKVARMYAAQPTFSQKLVYAPDTSWADMVISQCESFPKGRWKDLADTVSQAMVWLRKRGITRMAFEHDEDIKPHLFSSGASSIAGDYGI